MAMSNGRLDCGNRALLGQLRAAVGRNVVIAFLLNTMGPYLGMPNDCCACHCHSAAALMEILRPEPRPKSACVDMYGKRVELREAPESMVIFLQGGAVRRLRDRMCYSETFIHVPTPANHASCKFRDESPSQRIVGGSIMNSRTSVLFPMSI
jgi:hypothetical protein